MLQKLNFLLLYRCHPCFLNIGMKRYCVQINSKHHAETTDGLWIPQRNTMKSGSVLFAHSVTLSFSPWIKDTKQRLEMACIFHRETLWSVELSSILIQTWSLLKPRARPDPKYWIQPTYRLHNLCLEVLTVQCNELRLFWAIVYPLPHTIIVAHLT